MSGLNRKQAKNFRVQTHRTATLNEYVTAIAWSPDGQILAASSAAGEIVLWQSSDGFQTLKSPTQFSVDCLSFSHDGQLIAAGGQDGKLQIWHLPSGELRTTLENAPTWVDQLAWSPHRNDIAFSMGKFVQVWNADLQNVVTTFNFEVSSVLDIAWHPIVQHLAIAGDGGVKIWDGRDWDDDPHILNTPSASQVIAWSGDGKYLASGNLDRTISVVEWGNPYPWVMRGFPGKIRDLAWSSHPTVLGTPLLAAASAETIVIWEKQVKPDAGWEGWMLEGHLKFISTIDFYPHTFLLASASEDGNVYLWHDAEQLQQTIEVSSAGVSCLAWQPQGQFLAIGGFDGELQIWVIGNR